MKKTTEHTTTLAEYLDNGGDPSKLQGYRNMVDDLVLMADEPMTEEDRVHRAASHQWPVVEDHEGPFGAWDSLDDFRAFSDKCIELIDSDSVRERFLAAMPAADRLEYEERVWELQSPMHQIDRERDGDAETCTTCNSLIDVGEDYLRIRERFEKPSGDDVIVCLACVRSVMTGDPAGIFVASDPAVN